MAFSRMARADMARFRRECPEDEVPFKEIEFVSPGRRQSLD
jgi:hypothetical protein